MTIRRFIAFVVSFVLVFVLVFLLSYQLLGSQGSYDAMEVIDESHRFMKIEKEQIQKYDPDKGWQDFKIKGIELSSFKPQDKKNKTGIDKNQVTNWLQDIEDLGMNVIKIPSIQPPAFYRALAEFNEGKKDALYFLHEIKIDEKALLADHNIFSTKLQRNFKKDIKNTINAIHGRSLIFNNKRGHSGIYLKDVSKYNLGYIIGGNTNPEIITLSNSRYQDKTSFSGDYYSLKDGKAFDVFVAQSLDYLSKYEDSKYQQITLVSYLSSVETDALDYRHEAKFTKDAKINLNKIESNHLNNLFVAYKYHPNDADFLDYEYDLANESAFSQHLKRIKNFYSKALLISDTGISSSRGTSKVDLNDGYHRGGFNEVEQGEKIVELLQAIDAENYSGFVLNSWQDDWGKKTSFNLVEDSDDLSAASYWHNVQASDESFGLMAFEPVLSGGSITIDGDFEDWQKHDYLLDDKFKLKVFSDTDYLYLYLESENELKQGDFYLGIDTTPKSGSNYWMRKEADFSLPVDFVIDFTNFNKVQVSAHNYSDLFTYRYKYYEPIVSSVVSQPPKDDKYFSPIYLLNRKNFLFSDAEVIEPAIYYETGILVEGNANTLAPDFNSLADFKRQGKAVEVRIPFAMLNIVNPIDMLAYGDVYNQGIEEKIRLKDLGFSIYDGLEDKVYEIDQSYRQGNFRNIKYTKRLKASYTIVQEYLK